MGSRAFAVMPGASASTRNIDRPFVPSAVGAAGQHGVEAGDARVGDEGLDPGEAVEAAVLLRAGARAAQVGAGLGLGHREGGQALSRAHGRQPASLLHLGAREMDRVGAEALHGEGGVGQRREVGEPLAHRHQRAQVEAAERWGDGAGEEAGLGQMRPRRHGCGPRGPTRPRPPRAGAGRRTRGPRSASRWWRSSRNGSRVTRGLRRSAAAASPGTPRSLPGNRAAS